MVKRPGWYQRWRGDGPLAPIGLAIGGMLSLALGIAVGVGFAGAYILDIHGSRREPLTAATLYDLLKVAFAVAAGVGGVIALVTAYRRQRITEFAQALARQQHELAGRVEDRAARDSEQQRDLQRELARHAEQREVTRLLNERFTTAAGQLGDDKPAVRLAGVYAMAGLADDWLDQRQTCVDVLCAYLRMPYEPDPGDEAPAGARQAFRAFREVRHTVIRVITAHLQPDDRRAATAQDWRGLDLDFTGTVFDGGAFAEADFSGGTVSFTGAQFRGGTVSFDGARFSGGTVSFTGTRFSSGEVSFDGAQFSSGRVTFDGAQFCGGTVRFGGAGFSGGTVSFTTAGFLGGTVSFGGARFSGGTVIFTEAQFSGATVGFATGEFSGGTVNFAEAQFSGGEVSFGDARFRGGTVGFAHARFPGGTVGFNEAQFSSGRVTFYGAAFSGGTVDFRDAWFSGGTLTFENARAWQLPPQFSPGDSPPPGVTLPSGHTIS